MMSTPPIPQGGGEATVAFTAPSLGSYGAPSPATPGLPGARGNPPTPARPSIDIPVVRAPAYGGGEEATANERRRREKHRLRPSYSTNGYKIPHASRIASATLPGSIW